jgi:hypothetical protein
MKNHPSADFTSILPRDEQFKTQGAESKAFQEANDSALCYVSQYFLVPTKKNPEKRLEKSTAKRGSGNP